MTVSELIDLLEHYDSETPVVTAKTDFVGIKYSEVYRADLVHLNEHNRDADDGDDNPAVVLF